MRMDWQIKGYLSAPQLPKGRTVRRSKWTLGRLKWSIREHRKLGLRRAGLIEEVAPSELKYLSGLDLQP